MKIAQLCHRYHPHVGGVERHVQEIAERLAGDHEVEVISADLSGSLLGTDEVNGVTVTRFRSFSPGDAYFIAPQIYNYIKKSDFDVIHAHNYHALPAFFASLSCQDKIFVFTPHYHGKGSTPFRDLLNRPYRRVGSRIFDRADKVICVSEYEKELVIRDFGAGHKVEVIPNGINLEEIRAAEPFQRDGRLILYIGRLDRYKMVDRVIEAMEFLPQDYHFFIGGAGEHSVELHRLIEEAGLRERVRLLGYVSEEEKYRWMKTCDLFINLSGVEAFGMTVLEALAAGAPAVVNSAGGLSEFAVKFREVKSIDADLAPPEALARLMEESVGRGVQEDLRGYDWRNIAARVENAYMELR